MDRLRAVETYPHLINFAAFLDKLVINVWGTKRKMTPDRTVEESNLAIGGLGRFYARCSKQRSVPSGNRFQLAYGLMRHYRNQSPFKFTLWAGNGPVLCADTFLVLDSILRQGYRARVSSVELAFDIEGIPLDEFIGELCTRAQMRDFKQTYYVGAVNSPWQAKFYNRTDSIGRIEFNFKSVCLRRLGIAKIQELYLLRKVRLWELVSFCEVDQSEGEALPPRAKAAWEWLERGLPPRFPASLVQARLREMRIDPSRWVVRSPRERLLRRMQRNLLF